MQNVLPKLVTAGVLALLALSFLGATPALAACAPGAVHCLPPPYSQAAAPVWATLNAVAGGNYPGGNEEFDVFVVNSDSPPLGNASLINETLTAPALPPSYNTGYAIGLPVQLSTGQAILSTIYLEIPANFTQSNFTAAVVINMQIANGTGFFSRQLTVSTTVVMLALPGTITTQSSTTSMVSSSQTTAQTSGISSSLFYGGIAIASAIVIILTALLARRRARPS